MSDSEAEQNYQSMVSVSNRKRKKAGGWQALGLDDRVLRALSRKGYRAPTPIQRKAIPLLIDGKDVVAMARTGSGKTAAFLVPLFQKLKQRLCTGPRALLISPTRELALQTFKFTKELGRLTGLRAAVIVGGERIEEQFDAMHHNPDIVIATPGRLLHLVLEMELRLSSMQYVVFDEADRLFEMGFETQLRDVLKRLPEDRQTLLFSATLPKMLVDFARAGLTEPVLVRLDLDTKISDKLDMKFISCRADDKLAVLLHLLRNVLKPEEQQTIIFCATKHHVEYLREVLEEEQFACSYLYSSLDPGARKINTAKFRHGETNVLIVTDVAARGVDIPLLDNVVNFHFPPKAKMFVHRVGRVARAGRTGKAYSLVSSDEYSYLVDLFLFLGRTLNFDPSNSDSNELIGGVPQAVIDNEQTTIQSLHDNNYQLGQQHRVSQNSLMHYIKSRPAASGESIGRLKRDLRQNFASLKMHPLFDGTDSTETGRKSLIDGIRNYKTKLTVFETNASNKDESCSAMKAKRKAHEKYVSKSDTVVQPTQPEHQLEAEEANDDYVHDSFSQVIAPKPRLKSANLERKRKKAPVSRKETEFFVSYVPSDYHSEQGLAVEKGFEQEAQQAVLDFTVDEGNPDTQRHTQKPKWDRKKKKFIGPDGNQKQKRIRTEDGTLVPATYKSGLYEKWRKRQRLEQMENEADGSEYRPPKFGKHKTGGKRVKNELRSKEQILKERRKKQRVQSYQKHRRETNQKTKHISKKR